MTTEYRPQGVRKSLSLGLIAIGSFMLIVNVSCAPGKPVNYGTFGPALVLILNGLVLYVQRANEEKRLSVSRPTP